MGMDRMRRYSLPPGDRAATGVGAGILKGWTASEPIEVTVTHADGTRQAVAIPAAAAAMIGDFLATLSVTEEVALLADDAEISPEDAAVILGISRPLVRRRMELGKLPFRYVGSHRRLRLADVLELKHTEAPMRRALDDLQADTDDLTAQGL